MANSPTYVSCSLKKKSLLKNVKCTTPNLSTNPFNFKKCNHLKTVSREKQTKIYVSRKRIFFAQNNKTQPWKNYAQQTVSTKQLLTIF